MPLAHKIELDPNNAQATYFARAAGCARVAYNWALTEWKTQYERGLKPSEMALRKLLNSIKADQFPYMLEVTKNAPQQAIKDLGSAHKHFYRRCKRKKSGQKPGYPKFKKKGQHDSFRADNGPPIKSADAVRINDNYLRFSKKVGWIKMTEVLRYTGQIKQAIISKKAGKWFVSILVDVVNPPVKICKNQAEFIGVDLGCSEMAVLSNGMRVVGPKPHKVLLARQRRLNKSLSRKKKGSSNWKKAKEKLARLHYRIANIRKDAIHKITTYLVENFGKIVIEDLNVSGMVKNHKLARSIMDQSFYEFRRQLEYKAKLYGVEIGLASRWYPSTKLCSNCGKKHDMPLSKRRMVCECGLDIDRDLNAAINLRNLAVSSTDNENACGEGSADQPFRWLVKLPSVKQELSGPRGFDDLNLNYQVQKAI